MERRRKCSIESHTLAMRVEKVSHPRVELTLDSIGRCFEGQGTTQTVSKAGPGLMSDIEGLHPFLGELRQRSRWSDQV